MAESDETADRERSPGRVTPHRVTLAREAPFRLGALTIEPALRRVAHDDGREEILEPRVMQVLVALARAGGQIVSRDDLLMSCWHGVVVGEDAINRVTGRLRRLADGLGGGQFKLETITKVGYRLLPGQAADAGAPATGRQPPPEPPAWRDKLSICVLPFVNMSGDPGQDYFADAITEDIVTALSQWRWFLVIAWTSSAAYNGADRTAGVDAQRAGRDLGVRYLLQGSVRRSGARVRVTAQLVDTADGSHPWAERFDRDLVDVLSLQDEITEQVVAAVEPAMLRGEGARAARKTVADYSALDCFHRGMWHLNRVSRDGYDQAQALFREAIERDPELSLGHTGLARILYGGATYGWSARPIADLEEARAAAATAIGLDPRDATAYFAAAGAALYLGDHAGALHDAGRSIALNPNFAFGHYRLGQALIYGGRPAEAVAPIERSLRLSPYDPQLGPMRESLALAHYQARDYDRAVAEARTALRLDSPSAGILLAAGLARLGRPDEAARALPASQSGQDAADRSPSQGRFQARPLHATYADPSFLSHLREGLRLARTGQMPT